MAKTNMVEREKRRAKIVKQYAAKRAQLKELIRSPNTSPEEREKAQVKLQKQPRDASASRQRKRCAITGRSRGVYRKFGLSRVKIREVANRGEIPGLAKASWWGTPYEHDRPHCRSVDSHSQRPDRGQDRSAARLLEAQDGRRQGAQGRGLHRGLPPRCRQREADSHDRAEIFRGTSRHRPHQERP